MEDDVFETAAAELEKSIKPDTTSAPLDSKDLGKAIVSGIKNAMADLQKGKGGQPSDLKADKDSRGSLVEAGKDPAESPKKSGQGYKESNSYEARKGHDADEDEEEEGDKEMPEFFKKKKKKKKKMVAKSDDDETDEDETDEDAVDATEFVEELGGAVNHINKSVGKLEEGLACFGELLADLADPRKDKLLVSMAKAIGHLVEENKEIKKALSHSTNMMKSIATLPGMPKIAGALIQTEETADAAASSETRPTSAQRDILFKARTLHKITSDDVRKAISEGKVQELCDRVSK